MGNVLLDAMQGTLICLDHQHVILDVSKTVKQYFGFEQVRRSVHCSHTVHLTCRPRLSAYRFSCSLKTVNEIHSVNFSIIHHYVSDANRTAHRVTTFTHARSLLAYDICSVRMMMAVTNEYRQVKVHRKKKFNQDTTGQFFLAIFCLSSRRSLL